MRKLLLGAVLLAAMLPVTTVYAATKEQDDAVKTAYTTKKANKGLKTIQEVMKETIDNRPDGMTVAEAMGALMDADNTNFRFAVAAAIASDQANAGVITKFALGKVGNSNKDKQNQILSTAFAAVTTADTRKAIGDQAKSLNISVSRIDSALMGATANQQSYRANANNSQIVSPGTNTLVAGTGTVIPKSSAGAGAGAGNPAIGGITPLVAGAVAGVVAGSFGGSNGSSSGGGAAASAR